MYLIKRLTASLLCALLCALTAPAQDGQGATKVNTPISQDVMIIIQQQQVRFLAQKAVREMQLQIFNQAGELVYESGVQTGPELNWGLQTSDGAELRSGLYTYTLSVKEFGEETARVRRGHLILDRAIDRDGRADRLWVTGRTEDSELTVAATESSSIAGVASGGARTIERSGDSPARDRDGRDVSAEKTEASKTLGAAAAASTLGRLAKFTGGNNELGDSIVTELNGNIGVGTSTPVGKVHILAGPSDGGVPRVDSAVADSFAAGWDFYHGGAGKGYVGVPGPAASFGAGELMLYGGPGTKTSLWAGTNRSITIDTNGAVGIGTTSPATRLHVEGTGFVEATIKSRNERAILALTNTLSAGAYTWTVESGVRGIPGVFGIYNRVTNRSGLEIDGSGLVSVRAVQITGGADLSEKFDVLAGKDSTSAEEIQPGMVVVIDPGNPGKLRLSRRAYDRHVAGVISGAGGVQPGMMMGQEGTLADGKHPVALGGRVYVWVDAIRGAVEPGDMLTTSATPGHAMKAANTSKAQGAIIGKAMTGLKRGKGLVLALITLR